MPSLLTLYYIIMDKSLPSTQVLCHICQRQISRTNLARHRRRCTTDRPAKRGGSRRKSGICMRDCYVVIRRLSPSHYQELGDSDQQTTEQTRRRHRRRAGFSAHETAFLSHRFNGLLGQSIRYLKIKQLLKTDTDGLDIMEKYTMLQIRDKIKCTK